MNYGTLFLEWGNLLGAILLLVSILIYLHIYARVVREAKKLLLKYYLILLANSYVFAFGLLCILLANGIL